MRASEWLFEQDGSTNKEEFNEKYHALREITVDLYIRIREKKELPKGYDGLFESLDNYKYKHPALNLKCSQLRLIGTSLRERNGSLTYKLILNFIG